MRFQPKRGCISNDDIQTPVELAERLVRHFKPSGHVLEPCAGEGNILRFLDDASWCEIKRGRDFFAWSEPVDWIFTNPPWSQIRSFMSHSFELAGHVALLLTVNHIWTKARIREMQAANFGIREILLMPTPKTFPPTGFQLGMVHFERDWAGSVTLDELC